MQGSFFASMYMGGIVRKRIGVVYGRSREG